MEVFAELRSKKEIEADMSKLVSAFISLAEDLLEEKRQKKLKATENMAKLAEREEEKIDKPTVMPRVIPTAVRNCKP